MRYAIICKKGQLQYQNIIYTLDGDPSILRPWLQSAKPICKSSIDTTSNVVLLEVSIINNEVKRNNERLILIRFWIVSDIKAHRASKHERYKSQM